MPRRAWTALLPAIVALLVFLPTLRYGFVWDDVSLIRENRYLADPSETWRNLTGDFFRRSGNPERIGHWRPAVTASFIADRRAFGPDPRGFHAVNVAMHAGASALVASLAVALGAAPAGAL